MPDSVEVAITSESSGQVSSISVFDISTGSQLMSYKGGGACASHAVSLVGLDYIIGAELTKPLLHVWPINCSESSHELRTVCPGNIGALAVSPCMKYLVAGIAENIHVWQVESGRLFAVASRHFQSVTCIRFTEDGSHFVSAGQDGMVLVWNISDLIGQDGFRLITVHSFQDHYLAVKDVFVGKGGSRSRITSVSVDGSCRVYDIASGKLLLSLIVDGVNLTSVTADVLETSFFLGCSSGDILTVSLQDSPRQLEHHLSEGEKESSVFKGHSKAVTSLSPSQNATILLSGSLDETVRLWHIESKQCVRIIQHKGPVNNAFIIYTPPQMFSDKLKQNVVIHRLERANESADKEDICHDVINLEEKRYLKALEGSWFEEYPSCQGAAALSEEVDDSNALVSSKEIDDLKKKNFELYKYATEKIFESLSRNECSETVPSLVNVEACLGRAKQMTANIKPTVEKMKKLQRKKLFMKDF